MFSLKFGKCGYFIGLNCFFIILWYPFILDTHCSSKKRRRYILTVVLNSVRTRLDLNFNRDGGALVQSVVLSLTGIVIRFRLRWNWVGSTLNFFLFLFFSSFRVTLFYEGKGRKKER